MDTGAPAGGVYGIDVGSAISAPTGVVDTYATLVDLLDLSAATCTPGIDCARDSLSLRSALTGGVPIRNTIYTEGFQQQKRGIRGRMVPKIDNIKLTAE